MAAVKEITVKERMENLNVSQVDMIFKLRERGISVQPPMMSSVLNGLYTFPKAKKILAACEDILDEYESKR